MNIHEQIIERLKTDRVFSVAWGRVGEIVQVSSNPNDIAPITICEPSRSHSPLTNTARHKHIHGATTFLVGDEVELVETEGVWYVHNVFCQHEVQHGECIKCHIVIEEED